MSKIEERPPSLSWLLAGVLVVVAAVWILATAVLGMIMGFVKLVILAIAAVVIVTWMVGRKADR